MLNERDDTPYSAAWIDCLASGPSLGRSLIHVGRQPRVPTLKRLSVGEAERGDEFGAESHCSRRLARVRAEPLERRGIQRTRHGSARAGALFLNRIEPFFFRSTAC